MDYLSHVMWIIAIPLLGSLLIPVLGWIGGKKYTGWLAVALIATAHILTWGLIHQGLTGEPVSDPTFITFMDSWKGCAIHFGLNIDALAVFMSFTASLIATLIAIYSLSYIEHEEHEPEYYFIVTLFVGAMMGLVFSTSLIFIYLFWEISALACWRLIGYFREPEYIWKADKAFLLTFAGAVLMLLGFGLVFAQYGSFDLVGPDSLAGKPIGAVALALIMAGIFSKSATVPLHTWLPDAGVAPSTITSLLHAAILVKIGLYGFARMFLNGMVIPQSYWVWILGFAMASAFISACAALMETNIKRLLAYSTVSQIGYTFLGLAAVSKWGYIGAILYIMAHGLAKGGLFLCAGIIEHGTHTKDMTKMGGLIKKMPITAIVYVTCALSIAGLPPLAGFFAKDFVITGLFEGHHPLVGTMAILTAILTLLYMLKSFHVIFLGQSRGEAHHEGSPVMVGVVVVLAVLTLAAGLGLQFPWNLAHKANEQREALVPKTIQISTQP
jgi:NADH:ubiquinone oxidoreductase subunit 5 (subunit L)/multisubunit Na+/H+ antiporter MnhA subunit